MRKILKWIDSVYDAVILERDVIRSRPVNFESDQRILERLSNENDTRITFANQLRHESELVVNIIKKLKLKPKENMHSDLYDKGFKDAQRMFRAKLLKELTMEIPENE